VRSCFHEKDKFVKKTRINSLNLHAGYRDTANETAFPKNVFTAMSSRTQTLIASLLGFSGVILGALGAHALKAQLTATGQVETWNTAVLYNLIHAVAILAVALRQEDSRGSRLLAAGCWASGVVLFSGSLYALSLGGPHWLGPVTPLGGVLLLIGWGCVATASFKKPSGTK
jgi:uncharacterized membrane protein YgdD (TMEM256/DUF423 family)